MDQCSVSFNERAGTLRGMHFQIAPHEEAKLVRCTRGALFDVCLDLRPDSPTYRQWHGEALTADNGVALFVPEGCAHGFLTLEDATEAVNSMGLSSPVGSHLIAAENTETTHNMVVCTLCSCYPWEVLGLPPTWYKSAPYRARAVIDPKGVLADFGVTLPEDTNIRVWDSTAETRFIVLPLRPDGTEGWDQEKLAALVTRDSMVGTGLATSADEAAP